MQKTELGSPALIKRLSEMSLGSDTYKYLNTTWTSGYFTNPCEVKNLRPSVGQLLSTWERTLGRIEASLRKVFLNYGCDFTRRGSV